MIKSTVASAILAAVSFSVHAAPASVSPAKQELAQKIVQLMAIDNMGVAMLQEPLANVMTQARVTLQGRAPVDRQEAALKDIAADAKKFMDENAPVVKSSAKKLIPVTVVPLLTEKFTEEELRQLVAMFESPVQRKFEALVPEMKKALGEKLAADTGPTINPKLESLNQRIGSRLRTAVTP